MVRACTPLIDVSQCKTQVRRGVCRYKALLCRIAYEALIHIGRKHNAYFLP